MEFIEAPAFTRNLLPGTGGFSKSALGGRAARQRPQRRVRIIYYHFAADRQIWLMTLYDKDEAADLTSREKKALKESINNELGARAARRITQPRRMR
ncbi:MAG: hypothetical protein WBP87_01535 [Candidatus Sulfotelmatobacter sp.]